MGVILSLSEIKRRLRLSFMQSKLAKEVGISQSLLAMIGVNKLMPSYGTARRMSVYLTSLK